MRTTYFHAITVSEPYASLLACGAKWVENRCQWNYMHRGLLAIHAGKGTQYIDKETLRRDYPYTGHIIAVGKLLSVFDLEKLRTLGPDIPLYRTATVRLTVGDVLAHEHTEGPVCLIFLPGSLIPLPKPIPCRGKQGIWLVSELAGRMLDEQLTAIRETPR